MKPTLFLRIASVLTLIHAALHTIGGVFGAPAPGVQETVANTMKTSSFDAMGVTRTYWDFHLGFGLAITIFMFAEGVVFWQLSSLAKTEAVRLRPVLVTFFLAYVVLAVNSLRFFFTAPVVVEMVIAACLAGAFATATADRADGRANLPDVTVPVHPL